MTKTIDHSEIISRAARNRLEPLGCRRKGRSRSWISDQGAWVIKIEFQPSGFSKGSYLNAAPSWLWYPKDHLSFDYGPVRLANFISFENPERFALEAESLAEQAAQAVISFRDELNSPAAIASKLVAQAENDTCWSAYHAAVATGLAGDANVSLEFFTRILTAPSERDWFTVLQNHCAELASKLSDPGAFRESVLAIISGTRTHIKLPADPNCLDGWFRYDA